MCIDELHPVSWTDAFGQHLHSPAWQHDRVPSHVQSNNRRRRVRLVQQARPRLVALPSSELFHGDVSRWRLRFVRSSSSLSFLAHHPIVTKPADQLLISLPAHRFPLAVDRTAHRARLVPIGLHRLRELLLQSVHRSMVGSVRLVHIRWHSTRGDRHHLRENRHLHQTQQPCPTTLATYPTRREHHPTDLYPSDRSHVHEQ